MSETRKLAATLAADIAGHSPVTATDQERTKAGLRSLRTDPIDPAISIHQEYIVKRTGHGILMEFRSVAGSARFSIEVENGMDGRNASPAPGRQILFRVGIHLGDVIVEANGDPRHYRHGPKKQQIEPSQVEEHYEGSRHAGTSRNN